MRIQQTNKKTKQTQRCPYCGADAVIIDGSKISPNKTGKKVLACSNFPRCDSYVSVHHETGDSMGTLANKELRDMRREAHRLFDLLWQRGTMKRIQAYQWLSYQLGLPVSQCHIGQFREGYCLMTINAVSQMLGIRSAAA